MTERRLIRSTETAEALALLLASAARRRGGATGFVVASEQGLPLAVAASGRDEALSEEIVARAAAGSRVPEPAWALRSVRLTDDEAVVIRALSACPPDELDALVSGVARILSRRPMAVVSRSGGAST